MIIMNKTIIVMLIMNKLAAPRIFLGFFLKGDTFLVYEIGKKRSASVQQPREVTRHAHLLRPANVSLLCPPCVTERALYHCD